MACAPPTEGRHRGPAAYPDEVLFRRPTEPPLPTGGPGEDADLTVEAPAAQEVGVAPWPELWRRRVSARVEQSPHYAWIVLATALFGLFSVGFTITILSLSIPTISADLDSPRSTLTWLVTGPILAFAIFGPTAGKLADLYGSRRVYLISLGGAIVFAGLTAVAWSAESLIAFRVLGATAGAATGPASMALINRLFPRERRVQAMGYWSMVAAGGPVIGAVVGGPIVEQFSWRWIFIAQVPLTMAGWLVAYGIYPDTERGRRTRFDVAGSVTLALGIASVLIAINRGPELGWGSPVVIGGLVLCPVMLASFVAIERRTEHPLIPLAYFRRRNFAFPIVTQFFLNFTYMGGFLLTGFLLQDVLGYSVSKTSVVSIARPIVFTITGPIAGYIAVKVGERSIAVAGALALVMSMVGMAMVGPGTSDGFIVVALGLSGFALGASGPSLAASIANAVDEADLGIAGATQQMASQVGSTVGMQILVTIQIAREGVAGQAASYHTAYLVGAAVAALGVVTAAFVRSTRKAEALDAARGGGAPKGAPTSSSRELEPA